MRATPEYIESAISIVEPCIERARVVSEPLQDNFSSDLTGHLRRLFESSGITKAFPKGSLLFVEGQPAERAFALRRGRVKISICTHSGKVTVLRIAYAGDLIGLASVIARLDHDTTAEALEDCRVDVMRQKELLVSLQQDKQTSLAVTSEMSRRCLGQRQLIASLALSDPVFVRLARLFLGWSEDGNGGRLHLKNAYTHQQIAEMIGTSRETVTRAIREMRERELVTLKRDELVIHDPDRLRLITSL